MEAPNEFLEEARRTFSDDCYATCTTGCDILEVRPGYARCVLPLDGRHRNAVGQVMGGVAYTLADFAFAVAANFHGPATVTVSASISYLGKVRGQTLFAETRLIKDGRRNCFYEVTVTDELDTPVAVVSFTGAHII